MCGFAGQYNIDESPVISTEIERMGATISYRGPDHVGYYFSNHGIGFCHRRLSIIDLSEEGNQPMPNEDNKIWIVFNGEISNYVELQNVLKKQGVSFKTKSDTEVIIKMYEKFGVDCLKYFNGMFSFVLWDDTKKIFFGARDRIGIKPFYYTLQSKSLIFGSEIKVILENSNVKKEVNDTAIGNYLTFDHQIDNQTWFKDIFSLEPGTFILIKDKQISFKQYWNIEFNPNYSRSFYSFSEELRNIVKDAVRINWRSDVPVGAHLSGGVDSSSIVSIATSFNNDIHTFSSAFDLGKAYDERREINIVANKFKTHHHQTTVNEHDLFNILPKIIWHLDEPTVGPAMIPMYYISKLVRDKGITVVNGGQGVDELFGGYSTFYSLAARNILNSLKQKHLLPVKEYLYFPYYLKKGDYFDRIIKKYINSKENSDTWLKSVNRNKNINTIEHIQKSLKNLDPFESYSYTRLKYYLPALLQQEDRLSMAASIEARVPLLDNRIVDLALQIPTHYKMKYGVTKAIFRNSMRGIVPDSILDNRIKRGYPTPISVWFSGSLTNELSNRLNDKNNLSEKYLNIHAIKKILEVQKTCPQKNLSTPIWKFLVLETWLRLNFS